MTEKLFCVDETNKLFDYKDDYSDQTIATKLNVTLSSVRGARLELFGKLKYQINPSTIDNRAIKEELIDLHDRFNKLLITLSVNKVADVRHLQSVCKLKDKN